jgi:hypothetical protein
MLNGRLRVGRLKRLGYNASADFSTTRHTVRLCAASVEMTSFEKNDKFGGVEGLISRIGSLLCKFVLCAQRDAYLLVNISAAS